MSGRAFDRVVVIMFENEFRGNVMQNVYMRGLAAKGIDLASYFSVMHPSNTNYVASIAGEICNISTYDPLYYTFLPLPPGAPPPEPGPQPLTQTTLADTIAAKGLAWRAYMESYATVEFPPRLDPVTTPDGVSVPATVHKTILDYPPYLNMHNPFVRFQGVTASEPQWKRIATSYDFLRDALDGTLPEYSWFTPDIWSCGHWMWGTYDEPKERAPILVDQLAKWLETFFAVLKFPGPHSRLPKGTMVVVTFDEADFNASYEAVRGWDGGYDGPNQIYAVLLGDMIAPLRIDTVGYNHYSLLRTIEKNFDLPTLGKNDADANWFRFLWGDHFRWSAPAETPIEGATMVAAAALGDALYVVYGSGGTLSCLTWTNGRWSAGQPVPAPANVTAIAMASAGDSLTLVCQSGGALSAMSFRNGAWSQPQSIVAAADAFSVVSFLDYGDRMEKVMLAWSASGNLQSQILSNGTWSAPASVGHQTDGAIVLAALGTSLYLIHKATGSNAMNVVSYNTAPFNVVTSAGNSNTTQYLWSPSEFPVQHFAAGPSRQPGLDPLFDPYLGTAPFAAATLDGVIHFVHGAAGGSAVQNETFSIGGILTPQNAVSYGNQGSTIPASNGYGTLAEAGWSAQRVIEGITIDGSSAMAVARAGTEIVLLTQEGSGAPLRCSIGSYR